MSAWVQIMWALGPSLLPVFGPFIAGAAVAAILLVWLELLLWSDRPGVSLPWKVALLSIAGFVLTTGLSYAFAIFIFLLIHIVASLALAAWLVAIFVHVRGRATFGIARTVGLAAVILTSLFWAGWFIDLVRNDQSAQAMPFGGVTPIDT